MMLFQIFLTLAHMKYKCSHIKLAYNLQISCLHHPTGMWLDLVCADTPFVHFFCKCDCFTVPFIVAAEVRIEA